MKTTALKLLLLVYRSQKLPVIGIDSIVTIPVSDDCNLFLNRTSVGWLLQGHCHKSFETVLVLGNNGNFLDIEDYHEDDEIWPAIIKWCVDRLY